MARTTKAARRKARASRALRDLRRIAEDETIERVQTDYHRFLECPELQQASHVLVKAAERLEAGGRNSAFTGRTRTPLLSPPGWLPPPI